MQLQTLTLSALHFPKTEWQWLRHSVRFATNSKEAPDAFLWAVKVEEKLWAWHPKGADLENGFDGMRAQVLILDSDQTELAAYGLYLKTTFTAATPSDIEWTNALCVLSERLKYDSSQSGLAPYWKEALESSGLEPHLGILSGRARHCFLTLAERQLLFDRRWDATTFELLEVLDSALRTQFVQSLRQWNLSASQAKEAANFVMILNKKMGAKTAEKILGATYSNAEEFRTALFRTAQPEFASLSQERIDKLRGLQAPARTSIYGDPNFEKDVLKITHTPRNLSDFESFKAWVEDPQVTEKIRALLEIYQ